MDAENIVFILIVLKNSFSIQEYNNMGNICVYVKNLDVKFVKSIIDDFNFIQYVSAQCLEVSKNLSPILCYCLFRWLYTVKIFIAIILKKLTKYLWKAKMIS